MILKLTGATRELREALVSQDYAIMESNNRHDKPNIIAIEQIDGSAAKPLTIARSRDLTSIVPFTDSILEKSNKRRASSKRYDE